MNGKPHPHAELIKQMVDDDTLRATCDSLFDAEYEVGSVAQNAHLNWRLVPPKPKTITIVANGKTYELPKPMRVVPEEYKRYYLCTSSGEVEEQEWSSASTEIRWLRAGSCHATREAAQAWVDAMAEIRGAK